MEILFQPALRLPQHWMPHGKKDVESQIPQKNTYSVILFIYISTQRTRSDRTVDTDCIVLIRQVTVQVKSIFKNTSG